MLDQPARPLSIPTTLQDSLMARVDRLGSAREVLQIGAAIGREFSYELLAAVAGLPDAVLQDAMARLTEAELVFLRGSPPDAAYTFKHALMQDTLIRRCCGRGGNSCTRPSLWLSRSAIPKSSNDARGAGPAFRAGRPERKGHRILASGRRTRLAPFRHEGIDRAS